MSREELLIGKVLRIGLWLSVLIVLVGGIFYLIQCGDKPIQYELFQPERQAQFLKSCSAVIIIQLGLFVLVLTQVMRVGLTAWLFFSIKDYFFVVVSLSILFIMIYSLF